MNKFAFARWRGQLQHSDPLLPNKQPKFLLDIRPRGPQRWSGHGGEKQKDFSVPESNTGRPTRSPITILTELLRTQYYLSD
jgi:hypothetical protein